MKDQKGVYTYILWRSHSSIVYQRLNQPDPMAYSLKEDAHQSIKMTTE